MDRYIDHIRRFNRAITLRMGTLDDSFLNLGRPFGEARLLYEIGPDGAEIRDLRARMGLDSGYVSRLLRALERQGLIETTPSESDGRVRVARLTAAGRAVYADVDRAGDTFAHDVLAPLKAEERERLVSAMDEVEKLMRGFAVRIGPEPAGGADAQTCLKDYFNEIAARFDDGFDPAVGLATGIDDMTPPKGLFLMARLDGKPVGCGAILAEPGGVAHLRRMWVAPEVRGIGLGRRLLEALEGEAAKLGLETIRLETNKALTEAQGMYRRAGYTEVAPFNDEHYADHWFEKRIDHHVAPASPV
ncbi:MAG: MarR family transcriptional regulator [Rhodospirillales bacterium]|nr:MarR family transcriptional regulator [Rhodospirillales bacterium]